MMQTDGRLYLHRRESPLPAFRAEQDVFEGRLVRFGDLSFESSIRGYFASHVSATHFFRPGDLLAALGGVAAGARDAIALRDLAGDQVTLGPADLLAIDVVRRGEVRISLPRDKFADEATARAAIERQGGVIVSVAPALAGVEGPAAPQAFFVRLPLDRREASLGALGDLDPRVRISDKVRLADLNAEGREAITLRDPQNQPIRLGLASVAAVRTLAAVQIPDDAYLLIEADYPRDHVHALIASAVLLLFGTVNLIGLRRGLAR
jgi:hypothetical protein